MKRKENAKSLLFTELEERDFIEVEGLCLWLFQLSFLAGAPPWSPCPVEENVVM